MVIPSVFVCKCGLHSFKQGFNSDSGILISPSHCFPILWLSCSMQQLLASDGAPCLVFSRNSGGFWHLITSAISDPLSKPYHSTRFSDRSAYNLNIQA
jgi:hypothetical protein